MGKQKKNTDRNLSIGKMAMEGKSQRDIAKAFDLSQPQVSNVLRDEDIKPLLDNHFKYLVGHAPQVGVRFMELVLNDDDKIASQNIPEYHKSMGITQAHPSIQVQNLYVDQRQQTLTPALLNILHNYSQDQHNTIDLIENKSKYGSNYKVIDDKDST